jgi:glycosyltransferase involved in cell wall biosynthesis
VSYPRILWLHRQKSAVSYYRSKTPAKWLKAQGYDITCPDEPYDKLMHPSVENWLRDNIGEYDLLMTDRLVSYADLPFFAGFRHYSPGMRMVVDSDDDWRNVPWWNTSQSSYKPGLAVYESGKAHYKLSELVTTSTEFLAQQMADISHKTLCVPNAIDPADWQHPVNPERASDPHVRILYGGASGHFGDLDDARAGLEEVLENPPVPLRLICFGALPSWIHDLGRKYPDRVVRLPWVPFEDYAAAVAWGGFDIALAPLADHVFNKSKSRIKFMEAAVQNIAFMCSDVGPYTEIPNGCAVKVGNTPTQWREGLTALLTDPDLRKRLREKALEATLDSDVISKVGPRWISAIETALSLPRIDSLESARLPSEQIPATEAPSDQPSV